MRQMKDSGIPWIKEIPLEWKEEKAKNMFQRTFRPVREEDETITCFRDGQVTLRKNRRIEGFTESLKEIGYQGIRKGDLVIHQMDAFAGAIGVSDSDGKGTPVYICCIPKGEYDNNYYCYALRMMARTGFISSLYRGIRERSSDFRFETFAQQILPVPSISEQKHIVSFLDTKCGEVDSMIALQEEMISELQAYKQSVITEAVTHGLNPNVKMKDSGIEWIGEIPENWTCKKLKFSCKVFGRIGFRGYTTDDMVDEGSGAITLSPSNMKNMKMDFTKVSYLSWNKYYESPEIMIHPHDVLMVKTGSTYGKVSFVDKLPMECTINPQIITLKKFSDCSKFIAFQIQSELGKYNVQSSVVGGTIPTIAQEKILNYIFPIPPLSEQQSIATYLDTKCSDIDHLISLKQEKIESLKAYKQSIIYEYVTGKLSVRC